VIRLLRPVWSDTLEHFRSCGRGRAECVVLLTGPIDAPGFVDEAIHPEHIATAWYYRIDPSWLHQFHVALYRNARTIRAQVHTHKGRAFHSTTDDTYPAVNTPGFLSLVLPRFALGAMNEDDMWLAELDADGHWQHLHPAERIEGVSP
jgi:hypothetical protein